MSTSAAHSQRYYPGLDSLRAIAILLVIVGHWLPYDHFLNSFVTNGPLGVVLFFVLSGYLITGILLSEKNKLDRGYKTGKEIFKSFYFKRSVRIFPLYYLTLFFLLFCGIADVKEYFGWHFFYGSNILYYLKGTFTGEYVSPLWSLSVEEQFYLFWPFLILFTSRRTTFYGLLGCIVLGTAFRMLPQNLTEKPYSFLQFLTPACVDCFAVGGLIAYVQRYHAQYLVRLQRVSFCLAWLATVYLFLIVPSFGVEHFVEVVFNRTLFSCLGAAFILFVITKDPDENLMAKNLENGLLVYIGKISYSLYLWHMLIPYMDHIQPIGKRFFVRLGILMVLSTVSYYGLEKPLMKWRSRKV